MDADAFRLNGHALVEWIATYLENTEQYPVLSRNRPGELRAQLPKVAPKSGVPFDTILKDFEKLILPGITHWNHPGFFGYFAISGSAPGILAEFLTAALNAVSYTHLTLPTSDLV